MMIRYHVRMEKEQNLSQQITNKQAEIINYQRILAAYGKRGGGRLYDQGARHLEGLRAELLALRVSLTSP